jgi:hypothetical protein
VTLRWPPAFALGHVGSALVLGVAAGSLEDWKTVWVFGGWMTGGALASTLICWCWPGFAGRGWKLWLVGVLANPQFLLGLAWTWVDRECLLNYTGPWKCMFPGMGPAIAIACLPSPLLGLALRWGAARFSAKASGPP